MTIDLGGMSLLGRLGVLRRRLLSGPRVLILCYHRVADLKVDPFDLAVTPANFAQHLDIIRTIGMPVRLRDVGHMEGGGTPGEGVCVTFDDGYADNFHVARPMLERAGVPATFFIATGQIGSDREYWWDEITRITDGGRQSAEDVRRLREEVVGLPAPERDTAIARALGGSFGRPAARAEFATMTADDLRRLAAQDLFEVGAHTVTHPSLPGLAVGEQAAEIAGSKTALEAMTGRPVSSFAYPYGAWTAQTAAAVEAAGFDRAVTVDSGTAGAGAPRYALPRLMVRNWSGAEFARQMIAWFRHAPITAG